MAETSTLSAIAYTTGGKKRAESVSLPSEVFDGVVNMPVMHQAVKAFLANQRLGLAATKTRGFVIGGNRKPWKQKGTGRARQGSTRAPQWVGGGTVFGPTPRGYTQTLPKKVRQLARKSALNARAREDALIVIESLSYDKPSTKQLLSLIGAVGGGGKKVLVLTDGVKRNVFLSGRNLQDTHVMAYADVSTYHILWSDLVIIESDALGADTAVGSGETHEQATTQRKRGADGSGKANRTAKPARKQAAGSAGKKTATKKIAKKTGKTSPAKKSSSKKKGK